MILSDLCIENFRLFGEADKALRIPFRPGLTALVGENDSGKSSIIDALRLVLGMRDQEFLRIDEADFHQPPNGDERRKEIRIKCTFRGLSSADIASFAEYLSYEGSPARPVLHVNWRARQSTVAGRVVTAVEVRSGGSGDGPPMDAMVRALLAATYLRPLRDAERAMSAGRGSRLSQILQQTKEVSQQGDDYEPSGGPVKDPEKLSVLGIGDYANALLAGHVAIKSTQERLNAEFLGRLSLRGEPLRGAISVGRVTGDRQARLRQLLEKLELDLRDEDAEEPPPGRGLGSNNVLFIACELLLLGSDDEAVRVLLIEEPEAHLHPQRQLRLMQFLQERVAAAQESGHSTQVIVTTHSPNLASVIDLESLVLIQGGKAFPLERSNTLLSRSDYPFLQRFLDVTKANLFFARGVLIVEGDAENVLLPTVARLLGCHLTEHGVSIVNVGGTGLGRFARIFQRKDPERDGQIDVPVACVTDLDVMPESAPRVLDLIADGEVAPAKGKRRWRTKADFNEAELAALRTTIAERADGQGVKSFVADQWTLEYDLAFHGLEREMWMAAYLAAADESIVAGQRSWFRVAREAHRKLQQAKAESQTADVRAAHPCSLFRKGVSKVIAAQYLSQVLDRQQRRRRRSSSELEAALPPYLVAALKHVTRSQSAKPVGTVEQA